MKTSSNEKSKRFSLNKLDYVKILTGAGVATAGALITYFLQVIGELDFGEYTILVVALASILANIARKFLSGQTA